jgi:hypothetical protein
VSRPARGSPTVTNPSHDRPAWATEPEEEYVARPDEFVDQPQPETTPSGRTVEADRGDAAHHHGPDRPPTDEEDAVADELDLDPAVAQAYEAANERGAHAGGEGRI